MGKKQKISSSEKQRGGSALVMVLLIIMILTMLVGSFGFEAHLEARYASYARDRVKATQLAQSGVVLAEMLMLKATGGGGGTPDGADRWFDVTERLRLGQEVMGLVEPLGEGFIIIDITPEPGRLNVNLLTREDWETLLGNIGIPDEYHDGIIDPILDWKEPGEIPRTKGAKTDDYYSRLDPPYKAKGGPFDTVRELLLVKGFSEAILTGGIFDPLTVEGDPSLISSTHIRSVKVHDDRDTAIYISGIEHMLTTYGDGRINIQSAPYDVLRTLPGVDDILAYAIMEEREAVLNDEPNPFRSVQDLFGRIDGLDPAIGNRVTVQSQYYRITSTGRVGSVERRIWCIAFNNNRQLRYLRWCEEP